MQVGNPYEVEQDLLKNQASPLHYKEKAHGNSIESLSAHPNGSVFATGSHDTTIKIWDVSSFKETMTLSDHKQGIWSLDYSIDGSLLASGSPDRSVLIWDSKKGSPGVRINGHKSKVHCVKFNEAGKILATCGDQGQLFFWDIAKANHPIKSVKIDKKVVYDISWSQDQGNVFVTTLGSNVIALDAHNYDIVGRDCMFQDQEAKSQSCATNFKATIGRVFCGMTNGKISWYQFNRQGKSLKKVTQFRAHFDSCRIIRLHQQKKQMLTSGRDGSVRLWDYTRDDKDPLMTCSFVLHSQNVPALAFINKELIASGSWDQKLALWKY